MSLVNLLSRLKELSSWSLSLQVMLAELAALSSSPSTVPGFAAHAGHSALLWLLE